MSHLRDATRILRADGPVALSRRTLGYVQYVLASKWWRWFYRAKSAFLGDDIVTINGVALDAGAGLAPEVVAKLRTKRYETDESTLIQTHARPDLPVVDLGAGIGYTAALVGRLVAPGVSVVAVEANPELVPVLETTRALNGSDFEVVSAAYSSRGESERIKTAADVLSSHLVDAESGDSAGSVTVDAVSLAELCEERDLPEPFQLFVDVEGSECGLVDEESALLGRACELLLIEFHPSLNYDIETYVSKLLEAGFELTDRRGDVYLFTNCSNTGR